MESKFSANPMVKGRATAGGDGAELSGGGRGGSKVCIRSDRSIFFEVDSMPGETTVVSWTKLLKDHAAEIAAGASSSSKLNAVPGGQFPPASSTVLGLENDGFFVQRRKLEKIEPSTLPYEQSKKKRKDLGKGSDAVGCENDPDPSKLAKPGKKPKLAQLVESITPGLSTVIPLPNVHGEDGKTSYNVSVGIDQSITQREKFGVYDRPEAGGVADVRILHIRKKVGVSARDRSSLLEKAIKDLEKLVAESRPPSAEIQHANNSARATKMVLPPEIKLELANVAKYAEATDGMIRQELVSQLMGIVGHLVHRRTLKRNLKVMVNKELSAKQEKETRVQLIKKEVAEMVTARIPLMKSKARASQHFQEIGAGEREVLQWKYSMDDLLEDKICDLYDLYVEGLEEKAVPQVRKLYAELSALWPNGFMDNHGISRAIRRAKDRRKASNSCHKDPEKLKRMEIAAGNSEAARDLYAGAFLCSSSRAGN